MDLSNEVRTTIALKILSLVEKKSAGAKGMVDRTCSSFNDEGCGIDIHIIVTRPSSNNPWFTTEDPLPQRLLPLLLPQVITFTKEQLINGHTLYDLASDAIDHHLSLLPWKVTIDLKQMSQILSKLLDKDALEKVLVPVVAQCGSSFSFRSASEDEFKIWQFLSTEEVNQLKTYIH